MEQTAESILIYSLAAILCIAVVAIYIRMKRRESRIVEEKIIKAREEGLNEPLSLHPVVNPNACIQTGACIAACPEKDILGIRNGKATIINASQCIGHGACFHACPTEAITLCIGTEKRGIDLPHVNHTFETNVPGIFIAGELGGMGLIRNAVEQGRQAVENIAKRVPGNHRASYDLVIIGAGPAGITGALTAKKLGLNAVILEQDTLGGTVATFPRQKIVMTSPMNLPLYGRVKLWETSKSELLDLWNTLISRNGIVIMENTKAESVSAQEGIFSVLTANGDVYTAATVLIAIGRRGSPRKLNIPGEMSEKVAYRLTEPEKINGKDILVVGGGDSAVEAALQLAGSNRVTLSYRGETFSRIKPANRDRLTQARNDGKVIVSHGTSPVSIEEKTVTLALAGGNETSVLKNDLIFIFAGGELPTQFLQNAGITITRKFGEVVMRH